MKVILWGINYSPESTGIAPFNRELCEYLTSKGHAISAVTSFPYYPSWRKRPEDRGQCFRTDIMEGVSVYRCWCHVPARVTTVRRILHELSFCLVSACRVLALPRADVYFVVSPPLALGLFAWVVTMLKRSRFLFHVQDLQPDAAVGLGMLKRGWLVRGLFALEGLAYAKAFAVSGISEGMMAAFRQKEVSARKRIMLPNWLRKGSMGAPDKSRRSMARARFGVADGAILAAYAGNLGKKQSLEILVEAGDLISKQRIKTQSEVAIVIAGDGAARADLEQALAARHFPTGVQLLPLLSDAEYEDLLLAADVALITQAAGTGQFFFPSKLLSVLSAGLPVIAVADADSELATAIRDGEFGATIRPGDAAGLCDLLSRLAESTEVIERWRANTSWVRRFSRDAVLPRFEAALLSAASTDEGRQARSPLV